MPVSTTYTCFCQKATCLGDLLDERRKGARHCLLVTARNIRGGILVDCQGYNHARCAADLPDKSALDLWDVPVDYYGLKLQKPRSQRG